MSGIVTCPHCGRPLRVVLEPAEGNDLTRLSPWLPRRIYNALRRHGIMTIEQLQARSQLELKAIPGIGGQSLEEIDYALKQWEAPA